MQMTTPKLQTVQVTYYKLPKPQTVKRL